MTSTARKRRPAGPLLALVLVAAGVAGCDRGAAAGRAGAGAGAGAVSPGPLAARAPVAATPRDPPVTAAWQLRRGVVRAKATLELTLVVSRHGRWPAPITVAVRLPAGVELLAGSRQHVVPPDAPPDTRIDLTLRLDAVPAEDVVAVVSSQTPAGGVHAAPRYRFGRPAPAPRAPDQDGPAVILGGHDYGRSVAVPPR